MSLCFVVYVTILTGNQLANISIFRCKLTVRQWVDLIEFYKLGGECAVMTTVLFGRLFQYYTLSLFEDRFKVIWLYGSLRHVVQIF